MTGSVQKIGNCYYCVYRIIDPKTGRKKQKWVAAGKRKRIAEKKLIEIIGEIHKGTYKELDLISFRKFVDIWLGTSAKVRLKDSTLVSYLSIINKHFLPLFGNSFLTDITTIRLQKYVSDRLDTAKPKTVINELVLLKGMFNNAIKWDYLKNNPAEDIERPRVEKIEMKIFNLQEIKLLLSNADEPYATLFLTALLTGMRRGELLGLQWSNVDFKLNQIHVKKAMWKGKFQSPKSKSSIRNIDLSPHLVQKLKQHRLACPIGEMDLVFPNSVGNPLDPDNMRDRDFLPTLQRAGISHRRFHDLRHTNVSLRIEKGQNFKYIQNQIGHSSIITTLDRYGHLLKEVHSEEAKKLDAILGLDKTIEQKKLLEVC